ncbi:PREDICTED: putative disease resistance RPP13-like protein 1 [Prunus mume]|uniref:Disease resistance RPP13-like protein 1 n=1 Tax=Prunus mume TaxID=102107 RepID=A0ABM0NYK9_PRUMU|nr:PREDICTED: putative disease resistance RPP13-like protein 1 [Prunus mume]XP_016650130.1 PREDICTED: putative disease resistance RPP13-like protein 1 [Prunus mume]XP_016650131.1 PREDICTED: putative disease resistance RPP13-like protein 1 [Prunus mume]XP_016650132.1 PREDICTED: putative disease resistance RPP13-like protein 1 [Prunus mume]XP_016650133.1 PREDICTED: putative disease resistance RPP13-like protein 1 [Prunus mume]
MALIGEALISATIQTLCDKIASPEFTDLFRQKKLDEQLLNKLKTTLLTLSVVLNDAEEKQIEEPLVRDWLDNLRHNVLAAEDLLDEIDTEALRCKLEEGEGQTHNLTKKVRDFYQRMNVEMKERDFYQRMNVEMKDLLERLEQFVQEKSALGLTEGAGRKVSQRTTTSLVHEPCVYGRDEVKENLLQILLSDDASKDDVSVLTIVGMGGVGKTTLARLLYNDDQVKEHFPLHAWVCVSEDYDSNRITKTLLESVTSKSSDKTDLNLLQVELREQLQGKKFLFVLDDLWNEKYGDWKRLQTPFTSGARGSKVIVTTRSQHVVSVLQSVHVHHLEPLSHKDCWFLLAKHAFGNENCSAPNLEEIGKQIARKCNGLPLAAETLGALLRCNIDSEEWNTILNSSIWELPFDKCDILPALGLSYHYLSSQLKRCFVYCSIFPKDYEFKKKDIVQFWIAEGLIPKAENGKSIEAEARKYFDELLARSLFQKSSKFGFTMHDLINDLAMFMCKAFCRRLEGGELHDIEKVRHFSYATERFDAAPKFKPLNRAKFMRTFLPISLNGFPSYVTKKVLQELLPSLRCLRVLSLSGYQNVTVLPDSIANLIHLRYLDLSYTPIEMLPGVLCNLYNLQTLLLSNCSSLLELPADIRKLINLQKLTLGGCSSLNKLPAGMKELTNLHHLDVSGTKIEEMPVQMGRLKSLRTLTAFVVGKSTGSGIRELKEFPQLRGKLSILKLQNVVDARDALHVNMKHKKDLKELEFSWGAEDADDSQKEKDVLDKLQPCVNLEKLTIRFYGGTNFPNWLGDSSFSNIQVVHLSDCSYCWSLPPVGRLPALKELCIERMKFVKTIGVEFYGRNGAYVTQPFRSLEKLEFGEMPEWEEWVPSGSTSGGEYGPDFPHLQELILYECPKLRGSLPCELPCLKKLTVYGCEVLHDGRATTATTSSLNYKSLEEFKISGGCQALLSLLETKLLSRLENENVVDVQCLPNCNRLQRLTLSNCPTLSSFPKDGLPSTLTSLTIENCRRLEFLPHEMLAKLTSLDSLSIFQSCDSMRSFPLGISPKLTTLKIWDCENLESLSIDENLSHLSYFFVQGCANLKFLERLHTLTALRSLSISNLPNLESFAEDGGLPPNLRYFYIRHCKRLRASSVGEYWGLQALVSLEQFHISGNDRVMETLLKEQLLPTTLHTLNISDLSTLKSLDGKGLGHLTSLQTLQIGSCPSLEFLPGEELQHLTSLQTLYIIGCPSLQCLPEEGLPPSLSHLRILWCPALEGRYNNKTGQDWAKISHIPCIEIGNEVII